MSGFIYMMKVYTPSKQDLGILKSRIKFQVFNQSLSGWRGEDFPDPHGPTELPLINLLVKGTFQL